MRLLGGLVLAGLLLAMQAVVGHHHDDGAVGSAPCAVCAVAAHSPGVLPSAVSIARAAGPVVSLHAACNVAPAGEAAVPVRGRAPPFSRALILA